MDDGDLSLSMDTCFWYDNWLGDKPIKDLFPRLFALELNKKVTVADKVQGVVSSSFRRPMRVGSEYQHLTDLNLLMESVSLSHSCDIWICDLSGNGEFRVKEVRNFLDNLFLLSYADATRWVKYIPIEINVFVWRARFDFLPTRVNLSRRGIDNEIYSTVDACLNTCEMWKAIERLKQGESINVQDLETNLFWEFGKFTSLDVNEIRAEKIARVANPLALVAQQQQKSGIQCYNCKEYGHVSRECQKPKRAKDAAYHREKMLLYKQEEAGI
nr:RNA-directed DNA polymerase, eukaryota [Tanacetum cinerariifolium]